MADDWLNYRRRRTETELKRASLAIRSQRVAARYQPADRCPENVETMLAGARCDHA